MKIQIRNITICGVGRIRKKLKENSNHDSNLYNYFKGVADSHWFGICIYRNNIDKN